MKAPQPGNLQVQPESMPVQSISVVEPPSVDKAQMLEIQQQRERERLVSKITWRIHQSLDLQTILDTAVADVRHFLQTDRVIILRFEPNWSGVVVVESVGEGWLSILGTTIKDPCFEESYRKRGIAAFSRAVEDIANAGLTRCYGDLLTQYQVRANLVLPIIQGDKPWGLLIAHHCKEPRKWQPFEVELLQELATQVAIAIQQSELYQQVQRLNTNLEQQIKKRTRQLEQALDFAAVLKRITDRIRDSLDERQILQTAVRELVSVLKVDYCCAALYNADRTAATVQYEFTHAELGSAIGQVLVVADTPRVHDRLLSGECFAAYENGRVAYLQTAETGDMACPTLFDRFAAKLLCPIFLDPAFCESIQEGSQQNPCGIEPGAIGYLAVIDQTYHVFSDTEVKLITQVASQCAIAIRQARLYEASQSQVNALERLNQLKDDFLSTISHELRTPVAIMKMAIQMLEVSLKKHSIPSEKTFDYLKILRDQCEREIELIDNLLNLQQLESGDQPLNPTEIQLQPWLNQWLQSLQNQTQFQQRILQIECVPQLPLLICDISSLKRILLELLNNACKHSNPESTIRLKVWAERETLCLSVCNSGSDIPATELAHIFDKFYRIPKTDPWKQRGTGLGLALVRQLVNRLNGSIQATSASGQTCFIVKLPLQPR